MKRRTLFSVAVLAIVALIGSLAGCGGGGGSSTGETPGPSNTWNQMVWNNGTWGP